MEDLRESRDDLTGPEDRFDARLRKGSVSAVNLRNAVVEKERITLDATFDHLIDEDSVLDAAQLIVGARRRFVLGAARSFGHAALFAADMTMSLSQVYLVDESAVKSIDILRDVRATDVLVIYSFRRYTKRSVEVAELFAEEGGKVVVVTDSRAAPLATVGDAVITVPTNSASYTDSPTSVTAATHLLTTLVTASAKGARRRIADMEELSRRMDPFIEVQTRERPAGRATR